MTEQEIELSGTPIVEFIKKRVQKNPQSGIQDDILEEWLMKAYQMGIVEGFNLCWEYQ